MVSWRTVWMLKIKLARVRHDLNRFYHTGNPMYVVWAIEEMDEALQGLIN